VCEECAAIRQRRIGDTAEAIEREHGTLTMTVIKPNDNTEAAIKKLHASFMRRSLAPAGIWTVERGEQFGRLHLNYISPKPLPAKWRNCETYSELLEITARDAAAYISKRCGLPEPKQYKGRLYGSWGRVGEILVSREMLEQAPIVPAASIEATLSGGLKVANYLTDEKRDTPATNPQGWFEDVAAYDPRKPSGYNASNPEQSNPPWRRVEKTKEERAAIMRKHLPNVMAAMRKTVTV
jgi:hypothetical protein